MLYLYDVYNFLIDPRYKIFNVIIKISLRQRVHRFLINASSSLIFKASESKVAEFSQDVP
jgi:hypothetical protein